VNNLPQRKGARWSDFDKYLKGKHLKGKSFVLTIVRFETEETHPRPDAATLSPVLYFRETSKGLIISPTNRDTLTELFGDDMSACIGKKVTLKAEKMKVAGKERLPIHICSADVTDESSEASETKITDTDKEHAN